MRSNAIKHSIFLNIFLSSELLKIAAEILPEKKLKFHIFDFFSKIEYFFFWLKFSMNIFRCNFRSIRFLKKY